MAVTSPIRLRAWRRGVRWWCSTYPCCRGEAHTQVSRAELEEVVADASIDSTAPEPTVYFWWDKQCPRCGEAWEVCFNSYTRLDPTSAY